MIGARFRTLAAARAALRDVRAAVPVGSGDVAVRPLGSTTYDAPQEDFLLAGRFEPVDAGTVTVILHSQGGRIIERRADTVRQTSVMARPAETTTTRRISRPSARRGQNPRPRSSAHWAAPSVPDAPGPNGASPSPGGLTRLST